MNFSFLVPVHTIEINMTIYEPITFSDAHSSKLFSVKILRWQIFFARAIHSSVQNICFRVCFRFSDTLAARRLKGYVKIAFESSVITSFI